MPIIKRKKTGGRPRDKVLDAYTKKYSLTAKKRSLISPFVAQLALCQSEEARRLLLGVSR